MSQQEGKTHWSIWNAGPDYFLDAPDGEQIQIHESKGDRARDRQVAKVIADLETFLDKRSPSPDQEARIAALERVVECAKKEYVNGCANWCSWHKGKPCDCGHDDLRQSLADLTALAPPSQEG